MSGTSERLYAVGPAAGRGDRPQAALHLPLERRHRPGVRRGHDRVGAGGVRAPGVLAQLQVPPAARPAHRELPRPRVLLPGRRRTERARRAPAGRTGHGRACPEHLAVPGLRRQGGQPAGRPVPRPRLLLQDLHQAAAAVAVVRARAAAVRARRAGVPGHAADRRRQALCPPRRAGGRRRAGRDGRRRGRRAGRRAGHAGRGGVPARRPPALGRRRRPGRAGGAAGPGRGHAGDRGAHQRGGGGPLRRQLDRGGAPARGSARAEPSSSSRRARRSWWSRPG